MKKCTICGEQFSPYKTTQRTCSLDCAIKHAREKRLKTEQREWSKRKKIIKKQLETPSQIKNKLQRKFNEFIRLRDRGKPCISCQRDLGSTYHAGHFYSVGGYPELRYDPLNVHGQCEHCNIFLHGNGNMYRKNLGARIGQDKLRLLDQKAGLPRKFTKYELDELLKYYTYKIKQLKK